MTKKMSPQFLPMTRPRVNWKVAGLAGEGIDVTGILFGKLCIRHGLSVFAYREYPSLIRGGHNTHQVHADAETVTCQFQEIELLIAFNEEGISKHLDELSERSVVIAEAARDFDIEKYRGLTKATIYDVPLTKLSRQATGHFLSQNVVSLAISCWYFGFDVEVLRTLVTETFQSKGELIVAKNMRAIELGYESAKALIPQSPNASSLPDHAVPSEPGHNATLLATGNHIVSLGALSAGVQYFSAYPMTPTSDILHTLAAAQSKAPLVVKHAEDEIAAINQVVGAAYAGARAMTASATGGYALMVEATSLAGVAETPLVIVVGQRPGPATGLPTWTCQSDLQFVIHAGHGEIPRVVLTPGSADEHFQLTRLAFELAERFHLLVYVLSDKFALESYQSYQMPSTQFENKRWGFAIDPLPEDDSYRRFVDTPEGWSPRSLPGQPHGLSITNSYEHDEFGYATEDADVTLVMNEKRYRKLAAVTPFVPQPVLMGSKDATHFFVMWGSTRLVLEPVIKEWNQHHPDRQVAGVHLPCVWPFPAKALQEVLGETPFCVIEGNQVGQLEQLVRQETGLRAISHLRKYNGRPFYPEEVWTFVERMTTSSA
jgi:2-oxoglutarate/2-oxoacid ferredoxin oxidoreductase subunit alpha